jgi:hypothetical protein
MLLLNRLLDSGEFLVVDFDPRIGASNPFQVSSGFNWTSNSTFAECAWTVRPLS